MSGVPDDVRALVEKYCEGFCADGGRGHFNDCTGCEIHRTFGAARPSVQPEPLTAREEAEIREDERDRLYGNVCKRTNAGKWGKETVSHIVKDWLENEGAMLPADRQRSRATPPEKGETE